MKIVNIILAIVLLVVGIIMGIIIKSWNGINWDYIEYGNLADWVSGIGTIAALSSSVVFFIFSNRPSLKFKLVRSEYNNDITVFIANNGRVPGAYEFLGMRILRDDSFFRFTSFKEYNRSVFKSASPWNMYELTTFNSYDVHRVLDAWISDKNNVQLEIGIRDGRGKVLVTRFSMINDEFVFPSKSKTLISKRSTKS